jgi:hypothetical protein
VVGVVAVGKRDDRAVPALDAERQVDVVVVAITAVRLTEGTISA